MKFKFLFDIYIEEVVTFRVSSFKLRRFYLWIPSYLFLDSKLSWQFLKSWKALFHFLKPPFLMQKSYRTQLETMLLQFVLPAFSSPYGHLRSKACWLSGQFADIDFREGSGQGSTFQTLFAQTVKALQDPDLPVNPPPLHQRVKLTKMNKYGNSLKFGGRGSVSLGWSGNS